MEAGKQRGGPRLDEQTLRMAVGALGVFHVVLGGWELLFPASFFDNVGRYGLENTHYVGDVGAFTLAIGIALLLAVGRPTWRGPILAVAALWYGLHAWNHLFDADEARSSARGWIDTILLVLGTVLLAWLARAAEKARHPLGGGNGGGSGPSQDRAEARESERLERAARRRD